jgi:hypothetical protein
MIAGTVEALTPALLAGLEDIAQVRDAAGNVLGYFAPSAKAEPLLYEQANALFDPAEMERRLAEERGKGRPLREVLQRLQSLSDVSDRRR